MRGWLAIYKKEMLEFARDKRVLFSAVLGPLLVEILILAIFGYVFRAVATEQRFVVFANDMVAAAPILEPLRTSNRFTIAELPAGASVDNVLKAQVADVVLEFPSNFAALSEQGKLPEVAVVSDPNEQTSQIATQIVTEALEAYRGAERERRLMESDLDPAAFDAFALVQRKAETGEAFGGSMLVGFLPYLIIIWAFYGGFSIVSDLVAGEKERGTLETLLVSPVSREDIAIGKFLALASVSLVATLSALLGVVGMGLSNLEITKVMFEGGVTLSPTSILAIALALIPLIVLFAAGLLALSTIARNQREVQGYLSLASFLVLIPAMMSQFIGYTDAATSTWIAFVPVLNTATVLRQALLEKVDPTTLGITVALSVTLATLALWLVVSLFRRESVLFRT
ncbi:MAG: ABC transporter permease [Armatimonadota bacterium]|nr:ABC transporter permease [Armatimonadota bacterium]